MMPCSLAVDGTADLHPGNIMLDVDTTGTPRLTLVDAGMVSAGTPLHMELWQWGRPDA
jgi:hypothetical protein